MFNLIAAVEEFNRRVIGLPIPKNPTLLSRSRKEWAVTAFKEELKEFEDAKTLAEEADAAADLAYFAIGRLHEMGVDPRRIFAEVHRANMMKTRGELSKRPGGAGYDAVKPDDWFGPELDLTSPVKPKIIVIGHGRHGKDTVAEYMRDRFDMSFMSSSMFCAERVVYPKLKHAYGSAQECFEDRANHREGWKSLIAKYVEWDEGRLGREIFAEHDVYCGIRRVDEFAACRHMADAVIWVDARYRLPQDPTCELTAEMADMIVDNNGSLTDLYLNVHKAMKGIL